MATFPGMARLPSWRRLRDRRAAKKAARRAARAEHRRANPRWYRRAVTSLVASEHRGRLGWVVLSVVTLSLYWIAFGTSPTAYGVERMGWGTVPFVAAAAALPLLLVRAAPLAGWLTSASAALLLWVLLPPDGLLPGNGSPWPWLVVHSLVLLALLAAVAYRESWFSVAVVWAGTTLMLAAGVEMDDLRAGWAVAATTVTVAGWLAGRLARSRRALSRQEEMRAAEESARVLLEERARIARDLHDIVAHRMSLVAVQAETARFRRPGLQPEAIEELAQISATAREALAETRTLLGVLRNDDDPVATAPQPGVEDLRELVHGARRAGLSLDTEIDCPAEGLGANSSLTIYRVAQEALSNVARHAPGALTRIEVRRGPAHVQVLVRNGPATGQVPERDPGPAHGLTGMRERVASAGGTVTAAPTDDGGFEVLAVLPAPSPAAPRTPSASLTAPLPVVAAWDEKVGG